MGHEERRRDYRFAVALDGTLARGRASIRVENVGYRGLLVSTGAPVVVGQLAQIVVAVPEVGTVLLHGVPVRVEDLCDLGELAEIDGPRSGTLWIRFGVRLLGTVPYWETYVRQLHDTPARKIKLAPALAREAS